MNWSDCIAYTHNSGWHRRTVSDGKSRSYCPQCDAMVFCWGGSPRVVSLRRRRAKAAATRKARLNTQKPRTSKRT